MPFDYPKLKYTPADGEPDYTFVRVADPSEEELLGEGYFDTPGEMRAAAQLAAAEEPAPADPDPNPATKAKRGR